VFGATGLKNGLIIAVSILVLQEKTISSNPQIHSRKDPSLFSLYLFPPPNNTDTYKSVT